MKKFLGILSLILVVIAILYYLIIYYVSYSEGTRAGELIKISHKGYIFKTWEGEMSQGVSESQRFIFSIEPKEKEIIEQMKAKQGKMVTLTYKERLGTFPWLGDTKYFVIKVEESKP